jgi:hypothetical protein
MATELSSGGHRLASAAPEQRREIIDQAVAVREATGRPVMFVAADYMQLYQAATPRLARSR